MEHYRLKAKDEVFVSNLLARLKEAGVTIHRYKARCINGKVRADKWQKGRVTNWPDGTTTLNLVDVPWELARDAIEAGLAVASGLGRGRG